MGGRFSTRLVSARKMVICPRLDVLILEQSRRMSFER